MHVWSVMAHETKSTHRFADCSWLRNVSTLGTKLWDELDGVKTRAARLPWKNSELKMPQILWILNGYFIYLHRLKVTLNLKVYILLVCINTLMSVSSVHSPAYNFNASMNSTQIIWIRDIGMSSLFRLCTKITESKLKNNTLSLKHF